MLFGYGTWYFVVYLEISLTFLVIVETCQNLKTSTGFFIWSLLMLDVVLYQRPYVPSPLLKLSRYLLLFGGIQGCKTMQHGILNLFCLLSVLTLRTPLKVKGSVGTFHPSVLVFLPFFPALISPFI